MNTNHIFCGICGKAEPVSLLQHIRNEHSLTPEAYQQCCPNAPLFASGFGDYLRSNRIHIADGAVKAVRELFGVETVCDAVAREHVPGVDNKFAFDAEMAKAVLSSLVENDRILLVGPTGSGKSSLIAQIAGDLAFVHNGILFSVDKKSRVSDTIIYRDRYLCGLKGGDLENRGVFRLVANHIGRGNKFVFMNGAGKYVICNESAGTWDNGLWYSNAAYKYRPTLYQSGDMFWDDPWEEYPLKGYCLECGQPLKNAIEKELGTCDLCGSEIYGEEWEQHRRQGGGRRDQGQDTGAEQFRGGRVRQSCHGGAEGG